MVERLRPVQYVTIASLVIVMFVNLFQLIMTNATVIEYIFYAGMFVVMLLVVIFSQTKWPLAFIFGVSGFISIADLPDPSVMSGGIAFVLFSTRIGNHLVFKLGVYFTTMLIVVGTHVFADSEPSRLINSIFVYSFIFIIDHLLYNGNRRLI